MPMTVTNPRLQDTYETFFSAGAILTFISALVLGITYETEVFSGTLFWILFVGIVVGASSMVIAYNRLALLCRSLVGR